MDPFLPQQANTVINKKVSRLPRQYHSTTVLIHMSASHTERAVVAAVAAADDDDLASRRRKSKRLWTLGIAAVLLLVLLVAVTAIVLSQTLGSGNDTPSSNGASLVNASILESENSVSLTDHTEVPHENSINTETNDSNLEVIEPEVNILRRTSLLTTIKDRYGVLGVAGTNLANHIELLEVTDSPQARALYWLGDSDNYDDLTAGQRLQRFALGSFYYATHAVPNDYVSSELALPWTSAERWLTAAPECEWEGIHCNTGNQIVGITLKDHGVSGSIPLDLALLGESLLSLDLTNNFVFMDAEALDVFLHLKNLETLVLEGNYIVSHDGLPSSFQSLAELNTLSLANNLLQGTIRPEYFSNLSGLIRLSVESNQLSGPLPKSLYELEPLSYLYLGQNIHLIIDLPHAIKTANWPYMCKYLDHWH